MELVIWERRPELHRPLFLTAFEGWNDAGDAATLAITYLAETWGAQRFATIDPEEFYDFTSTRPHTRLIGDRLRTIDWPTVELLSASVPGIERDVILLRGVEPQLRWRTFCETVVGVARSLGAELAIGLGALLADVPHTRPVRVSGSTEDKELARRLGLVESTYEGPTGILGILHHTCVEAGLPSASFWAAVPHYVHQIPSPKAALALVERSAEVFGVRVNPLELRVAADAYEREVSERVDDDEDAAAYVTQLEAAEDELPAFGTGVPLSDGDATVLADEVEQFLREHRSDG
jgi:predicted ATP-grasp superfamily ATP-dependent carboligase